jgi:hypothetical protein
MPESVKKAAARKPRTAATPKAEIAAAETKAKTAAPKTAAKKKPAPKSKSNLLLMVSREEIAVLAHRFWLERGGQHGHDAEDWIRAEQTLIGKAS